MGRACGSSVQFTRNPADASAAPQWTCTWRPKSFKGLGPLLRRHPSVWIIPVLATLLLSAAGIAGVLLAADDQVAQAIRAAQGFADNSAVSINSEMEVMGSAPLLAMAAFVQEDPEYSSLQRWFYPVARKLLMAIPGASSGTILQVAPQGYLSHLYPIKGNEAVIGWNLLNSTTDRVAVLETIRRRNMTIQGPFKVVQGFQGLIFRIPIFIPNVTENETFGAPHPVDNCNICPGPPAGPSAPQPSSCDVCWDPLTRSKFWGFVAVVVNVERLSSGTDVRLAHLEELGYDYALYAPQPGGDTTLVARSANLPASPVTATVHLPSGINDDLSWKLLVSPRAGWMPVWRGPMVGVVIIVSALIGALGFCILVNRWRLLWAVDELQAANKALADEKERMDVLLARQYDLICCALGEDERRLARKASGLAQAQDAGPGNSDGQQQAQHEVKPVPHQTALERIEDMRRDICVRRASCDNAADDILLLELLGEGAFGRVYRGMWRGSEVAVKVMLLPAKMSGTERRERMAIMEAAISSAMHHPNILQTYTYSIKTVVDSYASQASTASAGNAAEPQSATCQSAVLVLTESVLNSSGPHTHSFEVSLVLELCDLGSLRDALDAGAFMLDDGAVNYAAVLDTASDVAKAMLHLHTKQVIHSDLKARNVLLKTDARSGRGAVAKVADFGLAVRIDVFSTHVSEFHGTLSHMAPETQLKRRVTKASDVYSFGITLWELYTGDCAYSGMPALLVSHQVCMEGARPVFPDDTPEDFKSLAQACWAPNPDDRPTFEEVLDALVKMRVHYGRATPPLRKYQPRHGVARGPHSGMAQKLPVVGSDAFGEKEARTDSRPRDLEQGWPNG